MTSLDDFFPLVAGQCQRAPNMIMRDVLRDAAIEFCKRTRLFSSQEEVITEPGSALAGLFPMEGVTYQLEALMRGERHLERLSRYDFLQSNLQAISGEPTSYYLNGEHEVVLGPIPEQAEALTAHVIARPSDTAASVNDALYSDWRQVIAAGARALLRRTHEPWMDVNRELKDQQLFEDGMASANVQRARGRSMRRLRVPAHYF